MTIALVLLVFGAIIAVLAIVFALERKKCPVCKRPNMVLLSALDEP